MLNRATKKRIDDCRNILVGQLPLPSDQINMVTLVLIYKFMNDIDDQMAELNKPEFFINDLDNYTWTKILSNSATSTHENLQDRRKKLFFDGIEAIQKSQHIPELFKNIFSEGNIPRISDNAVFGRLLDEINKFKYDNSEEIGNAFEYLLMTMGTQSKNGQFRTPRHIIDFLVEVVAPDKDDNFLDPACGTAGFLIAAFNYLRWKYTSEDKKEVLMEFTGEIEAEITKEIKSKKDKNEIVFEKTTVIHKVYSSVSNIFIENAKTDNDVLLAPDTYKIKKAEIVYKKHLLSIENGTISNNGTHWQIQDFEIKKVKLQENIQDFQHIKTLELKPIQYANMLNVTDLNHFNTAFQGYDNTPLMVRLAKVNMYLHQFKTPQIHNYDTISNNERWNENYSCILANPPFMTPTGGVKAHNQFNFQSTKAEVLFSDYILSHLKVDGKAGFIIPEGIIFTNSDDYTQLRKQLINDLGLWGVISLPAGVFQPYSGVKTSILLVDKKISKKTNSILLVKIENDGYTLNTNRNPLDTSDLPNAIKLMTDYKNAILNEVVENENNQIDNQTTQHKKFVEKNSQILHKDDFAKLDAYKSANKALDALKKAYKIITSYQLKMNKENPKQQKQLRTLTDNFLNDSGLPQLPENENELKTLFNDLIKTKAIAYGTLDFETYGDLKDLKPLYKNAIDNQREYNLSFDKHSAGNEEVAISSYEMFELQEIAEIKKGSSITKKDTNETGDIPVIAGGQKPAYFHNIANRFGDTITVSSSGAYAGFINFFKSPIFASDCTTIQCDNEKCRTDFLYYILKSKQEDFYSLQQGGAQPHVYAKDFGKILIPLPPLSVQSALVLEIEKYQKVIDGARQVIAHYAPQIPIKEEWERVKLAEVCMFQYGYTDTAKDIGDVRFVRITDIDDSGELKITDKKFVLLSEESKQFTLNNCDLLVVRTGATFGKVLFFESSEVSVFASYLIRLKLNMELISPKFYWYFSKSQSYENQKNNLVTGGGQPQFNANVMQDIEIPLPPLSVQLEIVALLESERVALSGCKLLVERYEEKIKTLISGIFSAENP